MHRLRCIASGTRDNGYRLKIPPSVPRTIARPIDEPAEPPICLPIEAAMPPTTRPVTVRVTSRAIVWLVVRRSPRFLLVPKMLPI